MSPDVSVVIPVRNDAERLGACLDALAAQVGGLTVQVIVADNGSSDGSAALANQHPAATTVVVESRRGSYAARNAGIAAADAPVLAFTDADCTPDPDWLVEGLRHLHGVDLAAGAVRMLVPREPSVWAVWDAAHYLNQEAFVADGFGATANLFVRRSTIDAVGPFDPALLSSGDLEFGLRATGHGHRLVYAASAVVAHPPRTTAREFWCLQRRLGAGWRTLAARGERPWAPRDPFMRPPFGDVVLRARERGLPVRRRRLAAAHALALAGRWTGRISGR
jgi:glycosyltransferase involved in cell wall biosynthesis